jgi:hypothetical protein
VAFRVKSPDITTEQRIRAHAEIVERVTGDGSRWISDTIVNGESAMRMMVISYLTEQRHLDALQESLLMAAKTLKT